MNTSFADVAQSAYIVKSYLYCGKVGSEQDVSSSDMRYAVVQVKETLASGEQTVSFAVPAALLPVVSYNVTLNKNNKITELVTSGAKEPIRLVYGVGLKEEINEQTIRDFVSKDYLDKNTNSDGSVNFYSNKYEADNSTGFDRVNTVAYFTPSKQNEKFYCIQDSPVYTDDKGTLLKGDIDSEGKYYCACTVYESTGGSAKAETVYKALSKQALNSAKQKDDGTWYIPSGTAKINPDGYSEKAENKTGTLNYANAPFVNYKSDDEFTICSTLGNNGKLTLEDKYVEPTKPTEPTCTTEPTKPTEPTCTTESTEPTEPTCTTEPTEPTDPTRTTEPTCTTEPTEPTDPTCTTEPTEPIEPTCTTEPTEPTEPTCTTEPTKPTEPTCTTEPTKPTEATSVTKPTKPVQPSKPINPSTPSTPDQPKNNGNSNNCGNTGAVKTVGAIQTGDNRNYYYILASLVVSGMVLYGAVIYRKRKRKDK